MGLSLYFAIGAKKHRHPIVGSALILISALTLSTLGSMKAEGTGIQDKLVGEWVQSESEAVCQANALAALDGRSLVILDDDDVTAHDAVLEARIIMEDNLALPVKVPGRYTAGSDSAIDGFYTTASYYEYENAQYTLFDCYGMGYLDDIPGFQTSAQVMGWETVRHWDDVNLRGEDT